MKTYYLRLLFILSIFSILIFVSSCIFINDGGNFINPNLRGSRNIISQNRGGAVFQSIVSNGSINVYIKQGNFYDIVVRTDDNLIQYLDTYVENGTLTISFRNNFNISPSIAEVYVTAPTLRGITINGSGNVFGQSPIHSDFLELNIYGSGYIDFSGFADYLRAYVSGSGNIRAWGLTARNAEVRVVGSGNAEITVLNELTAIITGSGSIYYSGNPRVSANVNGSGKVIRR